MSAESVLEQLSREVVAGERLSFVVRGTEAEAILALIARVRAAEASADALRDALYVCAVEQVELLTERDEARAEVARLRKIFDDAGQGEHNALALIEHYQEVARKERAERWEAYPRALQAAAAAVLRADHHLFDDVDPSDRDEFLDDIANHILDLSADEIDRIDAAQEAEHD